MPTRWTIFPPFKVNFDIEINLLCGTRPTRIVVPLFAVNPDCAWSSCAGDQDVMSLGASITQIAYVQCYQWDMWWASAGRVQRVQWGFLIPRSSIQPSLGSYTISAFIDKVSLPRNLEASIVFIVSIGTMPVFVVRVVAPQLDPLTNQRTPFNIDFPLSRRCALLRASLFHWKFASI